MFVLATIKDTVKVAPGKFSADALSVLTAQIEAKFADRVIADVGLCLCLHSYESIGDPYVYPSDGSAHYKVRFRMLVFRPFVGEILAGRVSSCTKLGVKVSLEFFENATIPKDLLQAPSVFTRGEWIWSYPDPDAENGGGKGEGASDEGEGSASEDVPFALALHDEVRFRVRTLEFTQVTSTATGSLQATTVSTARGSGGAAGAVGRGGGAAGGAEPPTVRERGTSIDLTSAEEAPSAMMITGSMNEEGLGLLSWWE